MASALNRTWAPHPGAEAFVQSTLQEALRQCPQAQVFERMLRETCAIRLADILDHIGVPAGVTTHAEQGWKQIELGVWRHFGGCFPDIVERNQLSIAFKAESVDRLVRALGVDSPIEGPAHGPYRRARIFSGAEANFDAVERYGWIGYETPSISLRTIENARLHLQSLRTRYRPFRRAPGGLRLTKRLAIAAIADLGKHWACELFMRAEREYWASRCRAGALQQRRQERLGVGWCNIDHYVYECSRETFDFTVSIFERLGFECREVLHGGKGSGWGVQVMEQPAIRAAVLLKLDLEAGDLDRDIAHCALSPLTFHGEVGLWTALHGESILEGGPSAVGARYDVRAFQACMQDEDFAAAISLGAASHLQQAHTLAEARAVDPKRVEALVRSGHLPLPEADDLRFDGASAVHFEALQREHGFKGFAGVYENAPNVRMSMAEERTGRRGRVAQASI